MTNFDFLLQEPRFQGFASVAVAAERILPIDAAASVLNCRRAMEFAIKWMYSVDASMHLPWDDKLISLMSTDDFRGVVDRDLLTRLHYIRKTGNIAAHDSRKISKEQAMLCLENLYIFMDFLTYCYGEGDYQKGRFDPHLVGAEPAPEKPAPPPEAEVQLEALMKENAALREELTQRRAEQQETYVPKPLDISEYETRKLYIDTMLMDAGWTEGQDWLNEYELSGMPNAAGKGFADYVLLGDDGKVLAVIEAKRTCVDVAKGRQQGKLYADLIERQQGRRPVLFLTNGFETRIIDNQYPERRVAALYAKRDLEKLQNLQRMRASLRNIRVDENIAGRYYQKAAVRAVCDSLDAKKRRRALLVMATGSGKTRTIIALSKVLLEQGWVRDILFLADRNSLVTQAKRSFVNLLPALSVTNLCEEKGNVTAHGVFSTYQTMMNCIDAVEDEEGKLFTCGHFDLVICDEAHRSIYNKYRDIFEYFDAPLVGLTATPKDDIDKNTYEVFELENGVPTYGYDLAQAVKDGYLVDYISVESELKFLTQGIVYDELSEEDKRAYEDTFEDEEGHLPESVHAAALNQWIFNEDTIKKVLAILMERGLRVEYGNKLGKTIIFAKSHQHAEKILEVFHKEYPHLLDYAKVIDNYMTYAQSAIDEFSEPRKLPQIAISVDMLDTGIDIPEILNLVFFKKVMSKAKFWQMIGRGTRLCPGLMDGEDKQRFYIFDFCGNFEFFRMAKGQEVKSQLPLAGTLFCLKFELAFRLQDLAYQTAPLQAFRAELVGQMAAKVRELSRENFAVRQHLRVVDTYATEENYAALCYEDTLIVREELAPLLTPEQDGASALRFDALLYGIELAKLAGRPYSRGKHDLLAKVKAIAGVANIPEVQRQGELIEKILHTDYVETAEVDDFEQIRKCLRALMKYVQGRNVRYDTNFTDTILSVQERPSALESDDLKNYKAKAEYYVRQHQSSGAIAKLRENIPLTQDDLKELETILWSEVGSKEDYEAECGSEPLGEFVRSIVGLDMNAAKEAFANYLSDVRLDSRQIYFVNQIVEYIVQNGLMKDLSVLQEPPFTDQGSIVEVFTDLSVWQGIRQTIDRINANARVA